MIDTPVKGASHASRYGWTYWIQDPIMIALALVAIFTTSRFYQFAFMALSVAWQIWIIAVAFDALG